MKIKETINIETNYKELVLKIWDKYKSLKILNEPNHEYRKYPLLPKTLEKNNLLFIGINPNAPMVSDFEKPIFFYPPLDKKVKDIPYYEKIKEIAKYCNNADWSHLDMLFIRERQQSIIAELCKKKVDFINAQLNISFDIIEKLQPKIIIVQNALVTEFFGKMKSKHLKFNKIWRGYDLFFEKDISRGMESTFDHKIGTYRINIGGIKTPIIFSSMLSGQRALDIGSMERLKWQIKFILENQTVN